MSAGPRLGPHFPTRSQRPGAAVALLWNGSCRPGPGLAPIPPPVRSAPAQPWALLWNGSCRPGPDLAPIPPHVRSAPAQPWRCSGMVHVTSAGPRLGPDTADCSDRHGGAGAVVISRERCGRAAQRLPLFGIVAVERARALLVAELAQPAQRARHLGLVPHHRRQDLAIHVLARVAGVGGEDERLAARAHPQRLVAGRMTVGWKQHDGAVTED